MTPKLTDEQIVRAYDILDKFDFFNQRAGRELWADKPKDIQNKDIENFSRDIEFLKDFINRLKADNERIEKAFELVNDKLVKVGDRIDKAKAEAIKEFAERLHQFNQSVTSEKWNREVYPNSWTEAYEQFDEDIDNILKELVGEG